MSNIAWALAGFAAALTGSVAYVCVAASDAIPHIPNAIPHLPNNAALSRLSSYQGPVTRDGYASPGDGGRAVYIFSPSPCIAADGGSQITARDGGCWLVDRNETIRPELFGATGDGATDDKLPIEKAFAALRGHPGIVRLVAGKSYYVSSLTQPPGATLEGNFTRPDDLGDSSSLFARSGGLILNPRGTITQGSSAAIKNLVIYRQGMKFPARDSKEFAGTAVACGRRTEGPILQDVMILGFALAISDVDCSRPKRSYVFGDNIAGVYQRTSYDTSYYDHIRFWPYATVAYTGTPVLSASGTGTTATVTFDPAALSVPIGHTISVGGADGYAGNHVVVASGSGFASYASKTTGARRSSGNVKDATDQLSRPGTAFAFAGKTDDTHVNHLLSLGYTKGFEFTGNGNILGGDLWADVGEPIAGSIGFRFGGVVARVTLGNLNSSGPSVGLVFAQSNIYGGVDLGNVFLNSQSAGGVCLQSMGGANSIANLRTVNCTVSAIDVSGASQLSIANAVLLGTGGGTTTPPIRWAAGATRNQLKIGRLFTDATGAIDGLNNPPNPSIDSANTIRLSINSDDWNVTGSAPITAIAGARSEREIVLHMVGTATINKSAGISLKSTTFGGAPGSAIALRYDTISGKWQEEWRTR